MIHPAVPVPEPGQLVDVRQRRYVVAGIAQSHLPPDPLRASLAAPSHLVTLTSVEDDALGEELQVIWEIEPGAQVVEKNALPAPTGFDSPQRLDTFLHAVLWGAVSSADVCALQAPFRSGVELEDYQLDPVARAIQMPRVNLLIADDVGLGKTIEAGLVAQELIIRHRARRILISCPAALQVQWRDQMRDKFGLEFRIVDSDLFHALRRERGLRVNPWTHFPRLITSIDFLKRERPLRLFSEVLLRETSYPRKFDLLIVDEAHNIAPSGRGQYATDSQRTRALRRLAPHFEHKLFLSATPHNGYPESFTALLELLRHIGQLGGFNGYSDEQIWEKVEAKQRESSASTTSAPPNPKTPEWRVLSNPATAPVARDFKVRPVAAPTGYEGQLKRAVLVERLREVRALIGFTRIESPGDFFEMGEFPQERRAPLSRKRPTWVPAAEVRGEGLFLEFREDVLQAWLSEVTQRQHSRVFHEAHTQWRRMRRKALSSSSQTARRRWCILAQLSSTASRPMP